jgi:hypothetical protein
MTFEAGADLVWNLFFGVFVSVMVSWLSKAPFVQKAVGEWVEAMNNATAAAAHQMPGSQFSRIGDEL